MTIQALIILSKLKKIQMNEAGTVYFDRDNLTFSTVHEENAPAVEISVKNWRYSLGSILAYLKKCDLVILGGPLGEYVQVTHKGWHIWQTALSRFAWFLFSSILVPVVVSAVTSLITLWINGFFQGIIPAQ